MLKFVYAIFLSLLLTLFVGVGISTFYKSPQPPESKAFERFDPNRTELTESDKEVEEKYQAEFKQFQEDLGVYNRNVSIISMVFATLFLLIGLTFASKTEILGDGLVLGGALILVYSIMRGMMSDDQNYRFIVVTASLVAALVFGYIKFSHKSDTQSAR